jgi:hypothetical protein
MTSRTYVVNEMQLEEGFRKTVWAWGTVGVGGPGFEEVAFTEQDGYTPADVGENAPTKFIRHLFSCTVYDDELAVQMSSELDEQIEQHARRARENKPDAKPDAKPEPDPKVVV